MFHSFFKNSCLNLLPESWAKYLYIPDIDSKSKLLQLEQIELTYLRLSVNTLFTKKKREVCCYGSITEKPTWKILTKNKVLGVVTEWA